jgi:hypothetical protein
MKYLKKFNEASSDDVYAFFTKELNDRIANRDDFDGHISYSNHAYQFKYDTKDELMNLKEKFPVGGIYNGETITSTDTLRMMY